MSNYLKVEAQEAIKHLLKTGRSQRWIARELGVHRGTVKRYAKELSAPKCTISRTGKVGRPSHCEVYRQRSELQLMQVGPPGHKRTMAGFPDTLVTVGKAKT